MKVFVKGLNSCGMRKANLRRYADFILENGHEISRSPQDSDVILLWTCAFRGDFLNNSVGEIKRYSKEYDAELIVCGCLPDIDEEALKQNFSGRLIRWRDDERRMQECFGAPNKKLSEIQWLLAEDSLCDDVEEFREENPDKDAFFIDQFNRLFVTEGCRFECAYCSERLAFPPCRSFSEEHLVQACRRMIERNGKLDVMLLGDSIGDYGHDTGSSLPNLMYKLKSINPDMRIALQGMNPASFMKFYDHMEHFLRNDGICHLQLPIQSASDRILNLMNRPYTKADISEIFNLLNRVGFSELDTHLIIGFPSETEQDIEETMSFILEHKPKYVLVSSYMESAAMVSSALENKVDDDTKKRRMRKVESQLKAAGILCNTDDSELSAERCRRLNLTQCNCYI